MTKTDNRYGIEKSKTRYALLIPSDAFEKLIELERKTMIKLPTLINIAINEYLQKF